MIFSNDQATNEALLNTLGDEQAAAWVQFYAVEAYSRSGELEYDRALAAAKKLKAAVAEIVAAGSAREFRTAASAGSFNPDAVVVTLR